MNWFWRFYNDCDPLEKTAFFLIAVFIFFIFSFIMEIIFHG